MLIDDIDAFLKRTGMSASHFGKAAVGDPNFVLDLRNGREPRSRLVERAKAFMKAYRRSPPTVPGQGKRERAAS